jgi:hypothetical protein
MKLEISGLTRRKTDDSKPGFQAGILYVIAIPDFLHNNFLGHLRVPGVNHEK